MANDHLTDAVVRSYPVPRGGSCIYYDDAIPGFGVRITPKGTRSFVLNYRTKSGRERRCTIGRFGVWGSAKARQEAARLRREIDMGGDPLADIHLQRNAPTMAELFERFDREHLPKLKKTTASDYRSIWRTHIGPAMGHLKVHEVQLAEASALHRKITKAGHSYQANRVVALLSKMFNIAIRWGWRADNPASAVERNHEPKNSSDKNAQTCDSVAHTEGTGAHDMALLDEYLTRRQLAEELEISYRTIMRYESEPDGLPSVRIGAKVRYRISDVRAWIERRTRRPNPTRKGRSRAIG